MAEIENNFCKDFEPHLRMISEELSANEKLSPMKDSIMAALIACTEYETLKANNQLVISKIPMNTVVFVVSHQRGATCELPDKYKDFECTGACETCEIKDTICEVIPDVKQVIFSAGSMYFDHVNKNIGKSVFLDIGEALDYARATYGTDRCDRFNIPYIVDGELKFPLNNNEGESEPCDCCEDTCECCDCVDENCECATTESEESK